MNLTPNILRGDYGYREGQATGSLKARPSGSGHLSAHPYIAPSLTSLEAAARCSNRDQRTAVVMNSPLTVHHNPRDALNQFRSVQPRPSSKG